MRCGGKPTERGTAFPINELKINTALQALIAIGATLWQLEAPDRIWPWFALGWACVAVAVIVRCILALWLRSSNP